jgi:hypothetical protein
VPFPAGGATDTIARELVQSVTSARRWTFVVGNRPGAGGGIGVIQGRIAPEMYARCNAQLGEQGMVELVGVLGCYCLVAPTLNAFEPGLPASIAPELQDPAFPASGAMP